MTAAEREQVRSLIDQERRRRLQTATKKDRRQSVETRRASYRAYYQRNREQISQRKKARALVVKAQQA